MNIQVSFSEQEIREFFEDNGFTIVQGEFGKWGKIYHDKDEWNGYQADAVMIDGKYVEASKLFEKLAVINLKQVIAPVSFEAKNNIETVFYQLLNSN